MYWRRGLLACSGVLLCAYGYFATLFPAQKLRAHPFFDRGEAKVIAHQGGRALWPENTLLAFHEAWNMGVDVLEMDVRWTSDRELVVMHDGSVDRTTDGSGLVSNMSLARIRELDAGYRFRSAEGFPYRGHGLRVPTLSQVLRAFPTARFNVEMKGFDRDLAGKLCHQLREYGASLRTLVASFDHAPMVAFRSSCPETATSATVREGLLYHYLGRLHLGSLYRSPALVFQVPERFGDIDVITAEFLDRARAMNARVEVWTVNDEKDMKRLLAAGVDGILTDYPDRLLEVLGRGVSPLGAPLALTVPSDADEEE
jgi:glycerophosphoryl diester phosphodiesterase